VRLCRGRSLCSVRRAVCGLGSDDCGRQRAGHRTVAGPEPLDVYAGGDHGDGHHRRPQRDGVHAVRVVVRGGHRWRLRRWPCRLRVRGNTVAAWRVRQSGDGRADGRR